MIPFLLTATVLLAVVALLLLFLIICKRRENQDLQHQILIRQELQTVTHACALSDGWYYNVLEADVTLDRLIGENCVQLTNKLGIPEDAPFSTCIDSVVEKMVSPEFREVYRDCFNREKLLRRFADGQDKFSFEFVEKSDMLNACWTRVTVCLYPSRVSGTLKLISYVKNIQEEKLRELSLLRLANTDYLTRLFNKRAAEERILALLEGKAGASRQHALLMIDIDRFKQVNDTIGHAGGDKAIGIVARLLEQNFELNDIVGRIGGDEFLVLIQDFASVDFVIEKAQALVARTASPKIAEQVGTGLTLSVGIALYPEHGSDYPTLFEAADTALYYVKNHCRNGYCLYEKELA